MLAAILPIIAKIQSNILQPIVALLFGLATLYFIYGVVKFIQNSANEAGRKEGAQHMMYGILGIFIMVSVYGLMNIVCKTVECRPAQQQTT